MSLALYIGVDIGKFSHVACVLSSSLLFQHKGRYEACPTLPFEQSRGGFEKLLSALRAYAPANCCHVLLENTGHYSRLLEEYLQEKGVLVYKVFAQSSKKGKQKSDKRDAQALAVILYNQVERHILVANTSQEIHRLTPPVATCRLLRGLVQHRLELVREVIRRKNKLTAIADELFPEFATIYANPNSPSALALRAHYPTPARVAEASLDGLCATRKRTLPSRAKLAELQALAARTIGTRDQSRTTCLLIEQKQLIAELTLLDTHISELEREIHTAVESSREGQILTSFPMLGHVAAASLLAGMGSIANFESAAKLRGYCGWSPQEKQTGTSSDSMVLGREGNRLLKHTIYLATLTAIRMDTPWRALYTRLVPRKCHYNARLGRYSGRMKVIGRIAGQIVTVIYTLLKRDSDLLARTPPGHAPPAPELYDAAKHRVKRHDDSPQAIN